MNANAAPPLRDDELDRYARHIILREIGGGGQLKLRAARVAVIGAGGLGSPCIQYLAAAGIGHLTIIDDDNVALSNLQRQILHGTADVGRAKTASAVDAVARINPDVAVSACTLRLTRENATELLGGHNVIADGSDSFVTRLAVADTAFALRIALVSAAVGPFDGQISTFRGWQQDQPCYRCFVGSPQDRVGESCADQGVLGALTGVIGAMQALEVIREITGFGKPLAGRILLYDALSARVRTLRLPKDPGCKGCGG